MKFVILELKNKIWKFFGSNTYIFSKNFPKCIFRDENANNVWFWYRMSRDKI